MSESALLKFYHAVGPDHAGRTIAEIWAWDHRRLEMVHDYIQWLFPLREPSRFNPDAPLLSPKMISAFHDDAVLRSNLRRSLDLMLDFFGLQRAGQTIERGKSFAARRANWLAPANHNHLRLTRIMSSLRTLGLVDEARALYRCLCDISAHEGRGIIAERTLAFWHDAASIQE